MSGPVGVALIGVGTMGAFHARALAGRVPGARLVAVADPAEESVRRLLGEPGFERVRAERDYQRVLADPEVEAVVVASPGPTHPEVIAAAAEAGKHVFAEKPLAYDLASADRALAAVERAGVLLQLGFQRRFDPGFQRARRLVVDGTLGRVYQVRSLTRDPKFASYERVPRWAIFRETLIHDFDVLRWLANSEAVEVYARADALVAPERRAAGLLDTALVCVRFASGAFGVADASFGSPFGYDVRAEVYGSGGMVTVGDGRTDSALLYGPAGVCRPQAHWFTDLFAQAYVAELEHFVACVRSGQQPAVGGTDGRNSLALAVAAIESVETGRPVPVPV